MLERLQQSFSEDHLRLQLREVISRSDAESQVAVMPTFVTRLLAVGAVILAATAVLVARRGTLSPHACAVFLAFASLAMIGAALMVWEYGRIARLLVRFLQRRERITE